ncbi:MAG: bifunctional ADP-dependent NAD(P)H-hydrate dehydratase/NAD(P)H-hydrate epimerase, partial [Actinobacteria bacterium]|nr:bifunctional ADP-dependent NAD(P)H-hydrate dehydratase/NAD(P)H-hydrate epimerase [Actinomycetota bacterium]
MRGLYPVEVVREAENALMTRVPDGSLMQRAARAIAVECVRQVRERRGRLVGAHVVLLVGSGNNGGDTLFAGAHLAHRGLSVRAICVGSSCHDAGARAFTAAGGRFVSGDLDPSTLEEECANADLIVDGIVGIGARGALRDA